MSTILHDGPIWFSFSLIYAEKLEVEQSTSTFGGQNLKKKLKQTGLMPCHLRKIDKNIIYVYTKFI